MSIKTYFWGLVIAVLAAIGWRIMHTETAQQWLHPNTTQPVVINFDNQDAPSAGPPLRPGESAITPMPKAASGLHKCRKGGQVIYTDGECPAGSKEQTVGGTVTVVAGQKTAQPVNAGSADKPHANVRDILLDPRDADLRDKRMDQIINR